MSRAFNMGVGLVLVCGPGDAPGLLEDLRARDEAPWVIGDVR
jgi:phosphoribosylaminoimidazole (AIR) synthetase